MKLKIIRIEDGIVTCQLEDGHIIDIAQKWFPKNISVGDILEVDLSEKN